jgi:hypothetical protein
MDISIALCALIVSVTSLALGIHHGRTMARMADANARLVAANSWPFLQFFASNTTPQGERIITWNVVNAGVGPAKIESVEVSWRGVAVRSVNEILRVCCGLPAGEQVIRGTLHGTVLRAGDTRAFLVMRRTPENESVWERLEQSTFSENMTMRVCYCSVFEECWLSDLQSLHPEPVQRCPVSATAFDQ